MPLVKWQEPFAHWPGIEKVVPSISLWFVFLLTSAFLNKPALPPLLSFLPLFLPLAFGAVTWHCSCAVLPQLTCSVLVHELCPYFQLGWRGQKHLSLLRLLDQSTYPNAQGRGTKTHASFPLKKLPIFFQTTSSASLFCSPLFTEYVKSFLYIKSLWKLT